MSSIWETTKAALDSLGIPVAANVNILASGSTLPDQYLVYQLIADAPAQHADNSETLRSQLVQVSFYSRSGLATVPAQVESAMLAAGFTRVGGREIPYNAQTRHFGIALDFDFLED
jgi:hypothetical protein